MCMQSRTPRPPTWPACWAIYTAVGVGGGRRSSGRTRDGGDNTGQTDGDSGTGLGRSGGGGLGGRGSRGGGSSSVIIEPVEGETPLFKEVVRIVADEISNSLIVLATPRDYDKIREVLARIDVVPRQVLIEAIIAEITLTGDLQFGIEYAFASGSIENILSPTVGSGGTDGGGRLGSRSQARGENRPERNFLFYYRPGTLRGHD